MYVNSFHKKSTLSGYQNSNLNTLNVKLGKDMQEILTLKFAVVRALNLSRKKNTQIMIIFKQF